MKHARGFLLVTKSVTHDALGLIVIVGPTTMAYRGQARGGSLYKVASGTGLNHNHRRRHARRSRHARRPTCPAGDGRQGEVPSLGRVSVHEPP